MLQNLVTPIQIKKLEVCSCLAEYIGMVKTLGFFSAKNPHFPLS